MSSGYRNSDCIACVLIWHMHHAVMALHTASWLLQTCFNLWYTPSKLVPDYINKFRSVPCIQMWLLFLSARAFAYCDIIAWGWFGWFYRISSSAQSCIPLATGVGTGVAGWPKFISSNEFCGLEHPKFSLKKILLQTEKSIAEVG